jgi:hypothetical protein
MRIGSASMTIAFALLLTLGHVIGSRFLIDRQNLSIQVSRVTRVNAPPTAEDHDQIRAMVLVVLILQAGGGTASHRAVKSSAHTPAYFLYKISKEIHRLAHE